MGGSGSSNAALEEYLAKRVGVPAPAAASAARSEVIRLSPKTPIAPKAIDMTQQQRIAAALVKAGISNPAAWSAAGASPSSAASPAQTTATDVAPSLPDAQPESSAAFDSHPAVVLMKGKNNSTFIISWRSQRDLAKSMGWKCTLMIWGGAGLALASLYVVLNIARWL